MTSKEKIEESYTTEQSRFKNPGARLELFLSLNNAVKDYKASDLVTGEYKKCQTRDRKEF